MLDWPVRVPETLLGLNNRTPRTFIDIVRETQRKVLMR